MSEKDAKILEAEAQARRDFLKKSGTIGVTAPAVALLLAGRPIEAQANFYTMIT